MNQQLGPVADRQLSFDVKPNPALEATPDAPIMGSLSISGKFGCAVDLNAGDEITVSIADADGQIIGQGVCQAKHPGFADIKVGDEVIGTERCNKAKVVR